MQGSRQEDATDKRMLLTGGCYLQALWFLGFVPVSVGTILSWEGEEDENTSSSL